LTIKKVSLKTFPDKLFWDIKEKNPRSEKFCSRKQFCYSYQTLSMVALSFYVDFQNYHYSRDIYNHWIMFCK
jgi:hypothetical protein